MSDKPCIRSGHDAVMPRVVDNRIAMPALVHIVAPSRLHFGLLSYGGAGRQYGGAGVMIEQPHTELLAAPSGGFQVLGPLARRVEHFARCWARHHGSPGVPACRLQVLRAPCQHAGLGAGTQLGLSVALAMNVLHGLPQPSPVELAGSVGRGLRSAVGTYGFLQGGLLAERGKSREPLAPLDCRVDLPSPWQFVLVRPRQAAGLSGPAERAAFRRLPPIPADVSQQLRRELRECLIPSVVAHDFDSVSDSLYRYGTTSGSCFATIQGGPYNGPHLARLVHAIRAAGIRGVGQSSWGPTLFALVHDRDQGEWLMRLLRERLHDPSVQLEISPPDNRGVQVRYDAGEASFL